MTYLYERVTAGTMADRAHRLDRYDQLGGYEGINALHEYLEQLAEDMGEPIELDIIALCCDWSHHDSLVEAAEEHDDDELAALMAIRESEDHSDIVDWFTDRTTVLKLDNGTYLIQAF